MASKEVPAQQSSQVDWTSETYKNAASFVPALATKVLQWLDPASSEHILDVGCGDGALTAQIAERCASVVGLDSSESFVQTAKQNVEAKNQNARFYVRNCQRLELEDTDGQRGLTQTLADGTYDKVFSNAAMHWILGSEPVRRPFFSDVYRLLKPGGTFVFEMGGAGNVADVHGALTAILAGQFHIDQATIDKARPWFFPSDTWMKQTLEDAGFRDVKAELEYRPTQLTPERGDGSGGLQGWIRLMCADFLGLLPGQKEQNEAIDASCRVLRPIMERDDGTAWMGYVRLRARGSK